MPELQALDLRTAPPRRWSEELGGVRWLPRMIDKARAAMKGSLGDYLYGQSPMDRSLLRALGISYKDFTRIVRESGNDDERVVQLLEECCADGMQLARRWSEHLPRRRTFLFLIDLDDGYYGGPLQAIRGIIRFAYGLLVHWIRYRWPARGSLIGLEVDAQHESVRNDAARGAEEEPYTWFTPSTLDYTWKILFSIVLVFLIFETLIRFVERIGIIFLIIIGAIFFAYLVYPIVKWLNGRLPLIVSILLVYAVIAGLIVFGLIYLIPAVTNEITTLVRDWPSIQSKIVAWVQNPNNELLKHAPKFVRDQLASAPRQIVTWLHSHGTAAAGNAVMVVIGTAAFIGACVAIPVLGAYLLYDSETIKRFFMGFIPARRREGTLTLLGELEKVIGGFIRGQLLVGLSVGTLIAIGLTLIGEPYAILIGAIAGALDLIPYIGPVIAAIPALVIAFIAGGFPLALKVLIVFVVANQAEGHIIAPNIVSRTIQLSPSAVVVAILIGGELYGVIGMFIAVPVAGIIRVLLLHVIPGSVSRDEAKPVLTKDPRDSAEEACGTVSTAASPRQIQRVDIIGVPMDLGASRRGVDMGPYAVRYARLNDRLQRLNVPEIYDHGNLQVPQREEFSQGDQHAKYFDIIDQVCEQLATEVEHIVNSQGFPIVLGGDHSIAMGTLAGLKRARGEAAGLVWVDAHSDINSPDTRPPATCTACRSGSRCRGDTRIRSAPCKSVCVTSIRRRRRICARRALRRSR